MNKTSDIERKAVVLLSGGLDSSTVLSVAKKAGFQTYALSFAYGQNHHIELKAAKKIAAEAEVEDHMIVDFDLQMFGGSALTDDQEIPKGRNLEDMEKEIPVTYVPARNTIFLSFGLAWAEVLGSQDVFIGVNSVDYSGYPDCRPEYIAAYETMANLATKSGVEGTSVKIHTPLIKLSKAQIIELGLGLGVDYSKTISCYDPNAHGEACGSCDSCQLRLKGFADNNLQDPAFYQTKRKAA